MSKACPGLRWLLLGLAPACIAGEDEVPRGHLQPFGGWMDGEAIEERNDVPGPQEFHEKYALSDNGHGKPVVFRGATSNMATSQWATDEYLLEKFGKQKVKGVEYNLKETRAGGNAEHINTLADFLNEYNSSDIYMVSPVPKAMKKDVEFLPCMRCGGYFRYLDSNTMWMGRGGSKSVIHYDEQDNMNCMVAGRKRFIFMHPSYKDEFEAHPNKKKNRFGWVDTQLNQKIKGYGAFMGKIDVDKVDLIKYPGWRDVKWSYVDMEAGDCVFIPYQWYHQVNAHPGRSINVHIWYFRPGDWDIKNCVDKDQPMPRYDDCTWGYEPDDGNHGGPNSRAPQTKCKPRKATKQEL